MELKDSSTSVISRKDKIDVISKIASRVSRISGNPDRFQLALGEQTIDITIDPNNPDAQTIAAEFIKFEQRHHLFLGGINPRLLEADSPDVKGDKVLMRVFQGIQVLKKKEGLLQIKQKELEGIDANKKMSQEQKREAKNKKRDEIEKIENEIGKAKTMYEGLDPEKRRQIDILLAQERYEKLLSLYTQLFRVTKAVADSVEDTGDMANSLAFEQAYKILTFFEDNDLVKTINRFTSYLKKHVAKTENYKFIHDTFAAVSLPSNGESITLDRWREFVKEKGKRALDLFSIAGEIEKKKASEQGGPSGTHIAPESFEDALRVKRSLTYKRAAENEELAELCLQYSVGEWVFDRILELDKRRKTKDNLPNMVIKGEELEKEKKHPGYCLVKLPIDDPRTYILGEITNCCQSIGGHSEECVIDGVTRENNGFYVLLKQKGKKVGVEPLRADGKIDYDSFEIVGQGYAWLSVEDNLVFDSWENLRPEADDKITVDMLDEFGKRVAEAEGSTIDRVMIGRGGKTPEFFKTQGGQNAADIIKEGYQYPDSRRQAVIYESKRLLEARADVTKSISGGIFSVLTTFVLGWFGYFFNMSNSMRAIVSTRQADIFRDAVIRRDLVAGDLEGAISVSDLYDLTSSSPDVRFWSAVKVGNIKVLQRVIGVGGFDVNAKKSRGETALMYAVTKDHLGIVKELLKVKGIDVNFKNNSNETALLLAAKNGRLEITRELLKDDRIDIQDKLFAVVQCGLLDEVRELLKVDGIDVNVKNQFGETAVIVAAKNGRLEITRELLKDSRIDIQDKLFAAVWCGLLDEVKRLLKVEGIDVNAKDGYGKTVVDYAVYKEEIKSLLIKASEDQKKEKFKVAMAAAKVDEPEEKSESRPHFVA